MASNLALSSFPLSPMSAGGGVEPWHTCGGKDYTGPTNCTAGFICVRISQWFSQCYSAPPIGGKTCICGGQPNTDVAGIGILVVLILQSSLVMALALWAGWTKTLRTRDYIIKVLLVTADVQVLNGMALVFSAIVHWRKADLYHLRLIFDAVSLVGVSIWPAILINSLRRSESSRENHTSSNLPRILIIAAFVILYFIFTVLLGIRLRAWNAYSAGDCYESGIMAVEFIEHPIPDLMYLGLMSPVLIVAIVASLWWGTGTPDCWHNGATALAALQATVHLFSVAAHRATDQNFLVSDLSDNEFGFGQVMILVLLLSIPVECYRSYCDWSQESPSD